MSNEISSSTPEYWTDPPWGVLIPGLSQEKAQGVVNILEQNGIDFGVAVMSPHHFAQQWWDRTTVAVLLAIIAGHESDEYRVHIDGEDDAIFSLENVAFDLREFLGEAPPIVEHYRADG